jgi:hypothetical protein
VSARSAMVSWFCVRLISKRWLLKIIQVIMKRDPFDAMKEIHVDFNISILHSLTPLVPQVWCEVNLDRPHLFHQ